MSKIATVTSTAALISRYGTSDLPRWARSFRASLVRLAHASALGINVCTTCWSGCDARSFNLSKRLGAL